MTLSDRIEQLSDPAAKDCDMDIDESAEGLSEAQKRLLIGDFANGPLRNRSYGQIRGALIRKGIFENPIGLTPLGRQVRAHLENTK